MYLLSDLGNSRLKWAWWQDGCLHEWSAISRQNISTASLNAMWSEVDKPCGWLACRGRSVRAQAALLDDWGRKKWQLRPRWLVSTAHCAGVTNAYSKPARLGADRWAALIAAAAAYRGNVVVIDCGTAITVDLLLANGCHMGGVILAGWRCQLSALQAAGGLPIGHDLVVQQPALANNSVQAIGHGTAGAVAAAVDYWCQRAAQQCASAPRYLLCGGDSDSIVDLLQTPTERCDDLVLRGLGHILENNA